MKKLIVLVGFLSFFSLNAKAETMERALMEDYQPVAGKEFAFEVKTQKFDQVILDCGGFVGWMTFYRAGKIAHNIYLDTYSDCPAMHEFLNGSKEKNKPVCLMVEGNSLTVSNEATDCP